MSKDKKLSIPQIAWKNLVAKKGRTFFMMFFVVLMSATFFFSSILMKNLDMGIKNTTEKMGADIIVVPKEGTESIRESLFAGTPCIILFDRAWEEAIRNVEYVDRVSSQLYIGTLSAECCASAVQIIAIDLETDFVVKPWLEENNELSLNEGEVIVGSLVDAVVGDSIKFFNIDFKVAGKLDETGMGYDSSVFMTFDTAYHFKESAAAQENIPMDNIENKVSMIMVDVSDDMDRGIGYLQSAIKNSLDNGENVKAYTGDELMSTVAAQVKKLSGYGNILTTLLLVSTSLALVSIFIITINERKYEFGILYTLGANKGQMRNIILSEALVISSIGGLFGVVVSYYLVATFKDMISLKLDIPYFNIDLEHVLPIALTCLLISVVTGIVAAVCSVYKISKGEAYRLIRESE